MRIDKVLLTFKATGKIFAKDTLIKLTFQKLGKSNELLPVNGTEPMVVVADTEWNSNKEFIKEFVFRTKANESQKYDEQSLIKLGNKAFVIKYTIIGNYNPNKSFWVEVGSNFDLVDGVQANNLFSGVFFYKRDIRPLKKAGSPNLGAFAGVYESKTTSNVLNPSNFAIQYFDRNAVSLIRNDSLPVFRDTGILGTSTVSRNIGLFFSPQVRLTNNTANADGFHVFASVWIEMLWQRISTTYDFSKVGRLDTIYVPNNQIRQLPSKPSTVERDIRSDYFGLGLPMYYKEGDVNLYFSPTLGISNQTNMLVRDEKSLSDGKFTLTPASKWNPFYLFLFRLNEDKYGISFTGEVRGFLVKNTKPFISLALSKKFDLNKFIEFK
jgi:hypothetical protein